MTSIREIQERLQAATPFPWDSCGEERGGCSCGLVHGPGNYASVAEVTQGKWGDHYPALRIKSDFQQGSVGPDGNNIELEAYIELAAWGEMPVEEGKANAIFIAHAREDIAFLLSALIQERMARGS